MKESHGYNTRRKAELLEYLRTTQGQHVTVNEIRAWFLSRGESIGTATIYRQLEHLISAGVVQKYTLDETSAACFAYIGTDSCHDVCIHCKCVACGQLLHLHCEELQRVQSHLSNHHGFRLEFPRTVLYGLCEACSGEGRA